MKFSPRCRGRAPDPERTAQTRATILRAALAAFIENGFERTRMADVAARAGVAKGTLYLHFADKEALFESLLRDLTVEPLIRFKADPAPAGETSRQRIERLFLPLLREFEPSGRASVMRLIISEAGRFPALAAMHRRVVVEPMMQVMQEALGPEPGRAAPLMRFPQLAAAPVLLSAVWNGIWRAEQKIEAAALFCAFLDLVFGPSPAPSDLPADRASQEGEP